MKILITGGNGYIARNLKPLFEKSGYEVLAPTHSELDLFNFEMLDKYCDKERPNIVIHSATRGGKRTKTDTFEDTYIPNIQMFENLSEVSTGNFGVPFILLGSGAEFDRRESIKEDTEEAIFMRWPNDPYGLSKNIISRRALKELNNTWVLRLFACFNHDEDDTRFIKRSIINLKHGLPIEIHKNMKMDFFYLDDLFSVISYIIEHRYTSPRNINLVYDKKIDLLEISSLIHKHTGIFEPTIKLNELGMGMDYTGNHKTLYSLPVAKNLIGLEEGIRRTCEKIV